MKERNVLSFRKIYNRKLPNIGLFKYYANRKDAKITSKFNML